MEIALPLSAQVYFLNCIKTKISAQKSFIQEISNVLNIAPNAVYKRMEGVVPLKLEEAILLSYHYSVSLDQLHQNNQLFKNTNSKIFSFQGYIKSMNDFEQWMKTTEQNLKWIAQVPESKLYYAAKDIPIFYFMKYPKLACFKIYFWNKNVNKLSEFKNSSFTFRSIDNRFISLASDLSNAYQNIEVHEIWNDVSPMMIFSQLKYYIKYQLINKDDVNALLYELEQMFDNIFSEAESGNRIGGKPFHLYHNNILLMDNSLYVESKSNPGLLYIPHSGIHYMSTQDPEILAYNKEWLDKQIQESVSLSRSSEIKRTQFFKPILSKIEEIRSLLH